MEENKKSKKIVWIIITIIAIILGIIGYVVYDNFLKVDKTVPNYDNSTTTTSTSKIEESLINDLLPNDMSNYYQILWDYEYLYNKYFTMKNYNDDEYLCFEEGCSLYNKFKLNESSNKKFKPYNFVKIENNKLLWNISGEWIYDKTITNDVKMFYIDSFEELIESFVVVTTDNNIYRIIVESEFTKNNDNNEYILTNEIYNSYEYNKIKNLESISNIKFVNYPVDCDAQTLIYFEIENNIFVLTNNKLIEVEKFVKSYYDDENLNYINRLDNTCNPYDDIININYDGILQNVRNNNSNIKVKYYLKVSKDYASYNDDKSFELIIDDKNNLYVIDRNKINDITTIKTLEVFDKVKNINLSPNKDVYNYIKDIELESGAKIIFEK